MGTHIAPPGQKGTARAGNAGGAKAGTSFRLGRTDHCHTEKSAATAEQRLSQFVVEWLCAVEGFAQDIFRPGATVSVACVIVGRLSVETDAGAIAQSDLAKAAGAGLWATRRAVGMLAARGLLTVHRGRGRGQCNVYAPLMQGMVT